MVLAARNADKLEKAAASIEHAVAAAEATTAAAAAAPSGASSRIQCIPCDVSVESSVVSLFEAIDRSGQRRGRIDLLVNNAGTNSPGATVGLSAADFERVLRVNVTGPFLCSREAMKRMKAVQDSSDGGGGKPLGGRIINIGSLSARSPRPDSAPYTASKFALAGLTRSLALDGRRHGVVVGILQPGNVLSGLLSEDAIRERRDAEGFLEAERVAECVLAMCSMPPTANVLEMTVLPTQQPYVGRG